MRPFTVAVPALPRRSDAPVVRTGFAEIDEELARRFASVEGMVVAIGRRIGSGAVISEYTKTSVDELKEATIDDDMFAIPPGLTYQERS